METATIIGLVIASIAITGGMVIAIVVLKISLPQQFQEKMAAMENQSKERIALIEKGIDPAILYKKEKKVSQDPLFWGLLLIGIGSGAFYGNSVWQSFNGASQNTMVNACALFFGGIGLVLYHFMRKLGDRNKAH
ncbi:MAG: DUF6249 domain-containing protein [Bacteroidota bacterium]